ncbi:hypothetical protein N7527_008215 [Penicillium freii]|nr:hypothetical protein N7527_008215 [Penicillium freii]
MCPSVPSSLPLISLTGFLANLDPYPSLLNLDSPAPNISNVSAYSVLSPFALAFDSSTSGVTWLGVPVESIFKIEAIEANRVPLCEQRLRDRYSEYLATILHHRTRSIVDPAVIAGAFT